MRELKLASTAIVLVFLASAGSANAQTMPEDENAADSTAEAGTETANTIVVTARRREESLIDVPESITVFSAQNIADAEIDEAADFAQLTPGVVVQQGFQGGDRPIIVFRGIGQIGGTAPSVVLLSDGVYLPAGDPLRNQLFDIERIEVVKGPQGALYGRDTIGGVVNVITKEPDNYPEFGLRGTYGSADEFSVAGAASMPLVDDSLFLRVSGSYLESDGFFDNANGTDQDVREEYYARARLIWDRAPIKADLRASLNGFKNGYNAGFLSANASTYIDDVGGRLSVVDLDDGFNERDVFDVALKLDVEAGFATITSISQYVHSEQTLRQDADFGFAPGLQVARTSDTNYKALSQELRLVSPTEDRFRWIAGAFYESSETDFATRDEEILAGLGLLGGTSNQTDGERFGLFGQFDFDIADRLTVSGAIRYDRDVQDQLVLSGLPVGQNNRQVTAQFSPKLSLTYEIADEATAYVSFGEGFRSGGFDAASSLPFGAELLESYEAGLKTEFMNGRLRTQLAAFHINYSNQQVAVLITDPNTGNLITTTDNLGESEIRGIEFSLSASPVAGLDLFANVDYLDTEITDDPNPAVIGNQTPFRTEYTLSLGGQYRQPLGEDLDLVLRGEWYRQGPQTWNKANTLVQESYDLVSVRAAIETSRWSLAISGENIFDAEFNDQIFEVAPGLNFTYPGLPARWRATATIKF